MGTWDVTELPVHDKEPLVNALIPAWVAFGVRGTPPHGGLTTSLWGELTLCLFIESSPNLRDRNLHYSPPYRRGNWGTGIEKEQTGTGGQELAWGAPSLNIRNNATGCKAMSRQWCIKTKTRPLCHQSEPRPNSIVQIPETDRTLPLPAAVLEG